MEGGARHGEMDGHLNQERSFKHLCARQRELLILLPYSDTVINILFLCSFWFSKVKIPPFYLVACFFVLKVTIPQTFGEPYKFCLWFNLSV